MALSLCSPSWEGALTNGLSSQSNDYIHHLAGDNGSTLPLTAGNTPRLSLPGRCPPTCRDEAHCLPRATL